MTKGRARAWTAPDLASGDPNFAWRGEVPKGWKTARLGDVMHIVRGITFPKNAKALDPKNGYVACLRTANVQREVEWGDLWFVPEEHVKRTEQYVNPGDILISTANSYNLVGKVAPVISTPHRATLGAFISLLRPKEGLDPKFAYHQIAWSDTQDRIRATASTTTNISNVSTKKLSNIELAIPPIEDQLRIVEEIEKQFSRLDGAVANLKRVKANLKRYKAAVLKAAVEGRLVETEAELAAQGRANAAGGRMPEAASRREGRSYETGEQLLQRILKARRSQWKGKGKYKEPAAPDTKSLPELSEGWAWATIGQAAECLDSMRVPVNKKERLNRLGNIPYYGANGRVGYIDDYIFDEPLVLVVEDETFTGRELPFSYRISGKSWVNNHAHVLRPTGIVTLGYLNYALSYYPFTALTTGTTGRKKLTQLALVTAPLGIPPLPEQQRIVSEVERRLSLVREVDTQVDANLQRFERLRQSTLARAFHPEIGNASV